MNYLSYNDIKRGLKLPGVLTKELAEETGIHIGDGYMNICKHKTGTKYCYSICGGYDDELYFKEFVLPLTERLYNLKPSIYRAKHRKAITLHFQSKGLLYFKNSLGLPLGKKDNIKIPTIISNSKFKSDFIRGLFSTDGCLSFKRKYHKLNYYPVLDISSKSSRLIIQVSNILDKMGFTTSKVIDSWSKDSHGKLCKTSRVFLYGRENIFKWVKVIGFSNPKHQYKFDFWNKYGDLPRDWKKALGGI